MTVNVRHLRKGLKNMELRMLRSNLKFFTERPTAADAAVYVEELKRELDRRGEKYE